MLNSCEAPRRTVPFHYAYRAPEAFYTVTGPDIRGAALFSAGRTSRRKSTRRIRPLLILLICVNAGCDRDAGVHEDGRPDVDICTARRMREEKPPITDNRDARLPRILDECLDEADRQRAQNS